MDIIIEYCGAWNYEPRALRVRERLEKKAQVNIKLVRGSGGVFEITIDNNLVFSKKALGRFPTDEEVDQFVPG